MKLKIALIALGLFVILFLFKIYEVYKTPDLQCTKTHAVTTAPPAQLKTSRDFFESGNYYYDIGNCRQAVVQYSKAIQLDPDFAQAYNNRAYTNMRMRNYKDALPDLDKAISIKPDYVSALMNRGDIYNYYYAIDRKKAIEDYKRVISLGKEKDNSGSVCGHKAMAETNNLVPLAILKTITNTACK